MGDSGRLPIGQDVPVVDETFVALERELGLLLRRAHASSSALARRVHPDIEPSAYTLLALIAGAIALLVLKIIGLVIKYAIIIALLITLAAWIGFAAVARTFRKPR